MRASRPSFEKRAQRAPQDDGRVRGESDALRANRLDIIPVGVNQKRRVVSRAVIRAWPCAAIVAAAGLQALGVEFLDRGMILGAEGDVGAGAGLAIMQMQPERRGALGAKTGARIVATRPTTTWRGRC